MQRLLIVAALAGVAWVAGKLLEEADKKANDPDHVAYEAPSETTLSDIQEMDGPVDSAETAPQP